MSDFTNDGTINVERVQELMNEHATTIVLDYTGNRIIQRVYLKGNKKSLTLPKFLTTACFCRLGVLTPNSQRLYLYSNEKLFVSEEGGATWAEPINGRVKVLVDCLKSNST